MKLTKKKIGKVKYPEKKSINLLVQETKTTANPKFQIALFVIFIVLLLVFVKFMVIDVISDAATAQSKYETMQSDISTLKNSNANYDKVRAEYSHYGNGYLNEEERIEADREKMLDVISKDVNGKASIKSVEITVNVAAVTLDNVTLRTVSTIVANLEDEDEVSYVSVSTAGTGQSEASVVTATLSINFKPAGGEL